MLRSVGAIIFGIASDRYGRKWPFVINNVLFIILELGTGFAQTYRGFLACRALFGIAMGGLYGNIAATALEDCPEEARGIISGMLQQGYAFGYLLVTAFARGLVDTTPHGWRPLFWFGACPPVLFIIFRLCLPETQAYRSREIVRKGVAGGLTSTFISEGKVAIKRHWLMLLYLVLLMTGFNFMVSRIMPLDSAEWTADVFLLVPWLPGSLPNPPLGAVQLLRECRDGNAGSC
jgi:SHS family lactate transporter-like MFS transporter